MIKDNVEKILGELPSGVSLVAATKEITVSQIEEAIKAGVKIIGENYVQEAERKQGTLGNKIKWHFIGHLQKNKVKKAVMIFDMIDTLDSEALAYQLDKECERINKIMPVLIEVNIAKEPDKSGVYPEDTQSFIKKILNLKNIQITGFMTMGPFFEDSQELRPYFRRLKGIFDEIKSVYSGIIDLKYLSMGMSSSYKIAIEEKANVVRIGTAIFGKRTETT